MMNRTRHTISNWVRATAKVTLLAAAIAAPLAIANQVNASTGAFIGETPTMSNGTGLVLLVSLQRD